MIEKLEFEEGFFEGEEREGFFVESMMKKAWAAQLVVLQEIDRICSKHGITYFVDFGTLLGAVRHKGFVPWDDDMDISMKRRDFQKFLQVADKELKEGYRLHTAERDASYPNASARVVNSNQISFKEERMKEFYGFPYVVGIDIFILDAIPRNKEERSVFHSIIYILFSIANVCLQGEQPEEKDLCKVEEFLKVKIERKGNIRQQILILIDKVGQLYSEEEADEIVTMSGFARDSGYHMKKEWFQEVVYLPFEKILVPAPIGYDEILKKEYGDYMKPVQNQSHEYPFYKKQEKVLVESLSAKE